ncbi:sporulation protein YtxC [Paraliobacillus sediminis]|uniref:sporulation protein YtxC n=1 Tax=Paraliobacillus sediminis TaxID=1885916 RepID=UPI0013C34D57|nr:sporulation protein YtxC [Paraliobacillus sediminis]
MLNVYLEKEQDAKLFSKKLSYYEFDWHLEHKGGFYFEIKEQFSFQKLDNTIALLLMELWMTHTKKEHISEIIRYNYYYQNDEEIDHILEIAMEMILGDELSFFTTSNEIKETIFEWFSQYTIDGVLDYEACVQANQLAADTILLELVGRAIDEWKQEEEYQYFVHAIREYVANSSSKCENVYMVQRKKKFLFYREDGHLYTTKELKMLIKQEPMYIVGLDENELNLTPLLALMPKFIYIYGDDPLESKTVSLLNIFEEQVTFKPLSDFPFALV